MLLSNFDRINVAGVALGLVVIPISYFVVTLIRHRQFYKDLVSTTLDLSG
jgi:hypothetical protein